ncbi:MAG: hypothetical protein AAB772_02630 [Patescibacteria group bacterium]
MDIIFDTIYKIQSEVFHDHAVDLKRGTWLDPWAMGLVCLKAAEFKNQTNKQLILPSDANMLLYLKRMHLEQIFGEFTYKSFLKPLESIEINERENDNVCEIIHCIFRDELDARLGKINRMFLHFGLGEIEGSMTTSLVGELGNNVFDHNDGQWPTSVRGAIILAQVNPRQRRIEVVVADPGIGFKGSLAALSAPVKNDDLEAIKLGLSGVTGRIGEPRGQGLRIVQNWTINNFAGIVRIHSGSGLVIVDKNGLHAEPVFPIVGTLASFMVKYQ